MSSEISKDEKERQLDAKIAAIRAKNEEKIQRQREVEKDRKQAEKQNQSITTAPRVKLEEDYDHQFVGPDRNERSHKQQQRPMKRDDSHNGKKDKDKRSSGRLRDGDGPPPDPGYRFLADRWRDGSDSEKEEEDSVGKRRDAPRRREDVQPWSRGRGAGRGGEGRGRGGGGGGGRGRGGGDGSRDNNRWSEPDRRRDQDSWESDSRDRGSRGGGRDRSRGGRGGGRGGAGRGREDRTDNFIKDMRRNVDMERSKDSNNSSDWNSQNSSKHSQSFSPRHKPRPTYSNNGGSGGHVTSNDWSDQMEDNQEWELQPSVPTAMVSPRKIEDMGDGKITVTKTAASNQQFGIKQSLRNNSSNYPYGVEPPPFKENVKPAAISNQDVGFSAHQFNKPFSSKDPGFNVGSSWKCPDPGCKQVNGQNRVNCFKCGISFKAANDYINNYACDKVKQEYSSSAKNAVYNKSSEDYNSASPHVNGFGNSSNPAIPQPMIPQTSIKDWNLDVEQTSSWGTDPHPQSQPLTTASVDNWGGLDHTNMMYGMAGGHMDPSLAMAAMMVQPGVQVPSYPPPAPAYYNSSHAGTYYAPAHTDYYAGGSAGDYGAGYQGGNHVPVFAPHLSSAAQVYIPPADQLQSQVYKAPPPFSNQHQGKSFSSQARPPAASNPASNHFEQHGSSSDPNLVLALNKPPNPLSLRRPQDQRQPVSKLQERLNHNRQSQDRDKHQSSRSATSSDNHSAASSRLPSRFQQRTSRDLTSNTKPPSMVEMQSEKGLCTLPTPGKGNGLVIFSSYLVDEGVVSGLVNIPVKYIPCHNLDTFKEKSKLLNPNRDWLVLLHGLGPDARVIAETKKTDIDKANDADDVANVFCDIIENQILQSSSHIYVLVSMLLPRIDLQESSGMGNPNNVRKVINVQITQRLYENPRVSLINSDKILDWGEDDVRLNELMKPDGFSLTDLGNKLIVNNWSEHIKKKINYVESVQDKNKPVINNNNVNTKVQEDQKPVVEEKDTGKESDDVAEEEEDVVDDPFGSYEAPVSLVSRPRTISTSGPGAEASDDIDDDSLPNLETVTSKTDIENLEKKVKDIDFDDVDGGGFIEDNYCGNENLKHQEDLPSMLSLGPASDEGLVSGHFMEDSYIPSEQNLPKLKSVEFFFESDVAVKIAGDFNSWKASDMEKMGDNKWTFLIDLPEGKYLYKYMKQGEWVLDETKEIVEKEGDRKNVIDIK